MKRLGAQIRISTNTKLSSIMHTVFSFSALMIEYTLHLQLIQALPYCPAKRVSFLHSSWNNPHDI